MVRIVRAELYKKLSERSASLRTSFHNHLHTIHEVDKTLEIDRAAFTTFVIWVPILILLIALVFSPQGRDLLELFSSSARARTFLLLILAVLDVVATIFATTLISLWFFPRLKEDAQIGFFFPSFAPKQLGLEMRERRDVLRAASIPNLIVIAFPISCISMASFGYVGLLSYAIWLLSFVVYAALSLIAARFATKKILWTIDLSVNLMWPALLVLLFFGWFTVDSIWALSTPIAVAVAVICWLTIFHTFAILLSLSRYSAVEARADLDRWVFKWQNRLSGGRRSGLRNILARCFERFGFLIKIGMPRALILGLTLLFSGGVLYLWIAYIPRAALWMSVNDGRLEPINASTPVARIEPAEAFKAFSKDLPSFEYKEGSQTESRKPFVLVTAAGGGIRAAYWTAAVLTELQKENPSFDKRVFAISAVSGGALGAVTFKALTSRSQPCAGRSDYRNCAAGFLAGDFVGPSILSQITGEIFKVFTRGQIGPLFGVEDFWERDQALQAAWSFRWSTSVGKEEPSLAGDFDGLFVQRSWPSLLLNGTSMLTGRRTIASNLNISNISSESGEPRAGCKSLPGTVNPAEYLKLSASSSVLTSARFPYITPGGLLPLPTMNADPSKKDIQCWDLIVDGGYVDNEGVITARELLKRLIESEPSPKDTTPEKNFAKSYRLIVLRLSNQPSPVLDVKNVPLPDRDSPGQLFSTFLNQQNATGRDLVNDFSKYVSAIGGCMIEINALHDDAPLGWTLSEKSRDRLDAWLDGPDSSSWKQLYVESDKKAAIVSELARTVNMKRRLQIVHELLGGETSSCDLKDPSSPK